MESIHRFHKVHLSPRALTQYFKSTPTEAHSKDTTHNTQSTVDQL